MTTDTVKSKPCNRNALFELAKIIYALHSAINQLAHIPTRSKYREELIERMNHSTQKFGSYGGIIETGVDVLGKKRPILSYPDSKEAIPYEIGQLACEKLLNF